MATMSLWAMYQWDKTLFDGLQVPSGINKSTIVNNLIMESAELEVLYTDPDFLKQAIKYWSDSRQRAWYMMQKVMSEEYDPFINIQRDETREIVQDRNLQTSTKADGTNSLNTAAWNDTDMVEREEQTVDNLTTANDTGQIITKEHFHVEGDSALTDAQDVAVKEFKLRADYDLIRYIINDFKKRFCLLIY